MKLKRLNKKGFSLFELLIVIAIISILVVFITPSLITYVEKSTANRDDAAMAEVTNTVRLAMSDEQILDEILYYAIRGNASCYADPDYNGSHDAKEVLGQDYVGSDYNLKDTPQYEYYKYDNSARTIKKNAMLFDGLMYGVTITFSPLKSGNSTIINIKDAVINCAILQENEDLINADTKIGTLGEGPDSSGAKACKLQDMKKPNESTTHLYDLLKSTVGKKIKLDSKTYMNSNYTIFISFGSVNGSGMINRSAVQVYGQWSGEKLSSITSIGGDNIIVPPTGEHVHDFVIVSDTMSTCITPGAKIYQCSCGEYRAEDIAAAGHNYNSVVTDPTCTEQGYTTHTCSGCGIFYVDSYTSAIGHNHDSVVVTPTCTEQGYTTHTCSGCGDFYVDSYVDAIGHNYNSTTLNGYTTYTCRNCLDTYGTVVILLANRDDIGYTNTTANLTIPETTVRDGVTYDVVAIGDSAFKGCTGLTNVTVPDSVTSVGNYAFNGCTNLISITIPDSVTFIGDSAFLNCSKLQYNTYDNAYYLGNENNQYAILVKAINQSITEIKISDNKNVVIGSNAFQGCTRLTSIIMPDSVTAIGDRAFYGCSGLTSITISNSVTSIGNYAFYGCSGLVSITLPDSVTSVGSYIFYNCTSLISAIISNKATSIDNYAFYNCSKLTSVITASDSITFIGNYAFYGCVRLTNMNIPDGVITIGNYAFYNCTSLADITMHNSTTSIGSNAFFGCSKLTSITIPDGVTSIGSYAFRGCTNLTNVIIPGSVTSLGDSVFYGCSKLMSIMVSANNNYYCDVDGILFNKNKTILVAYPAGKTGSAYAIPNSVTSISSSAFSSCSKLTSITIPSSVTSFGGYAFFGCSSLTSITIPNSVTSFGYYVFGGCSKLTNIIIPNSITSISNNAFQGCVALTSISIPNSVTKIGMNAFQGCSNLTSVVIPDSMTSIGNYAFRGCSKLTNITIPDGVISISDSTFYDCSGLTNITVSANNANYCDIDGVLFNKNKTTLIQYPAGKTDSVYIIPDSVTSISSNPFFSCKNLTSVTIPGSITSIGNYAFYGCTNLTSINFIGIKAQWNAITKGSNWNANTGGYTINCTDGNIAKS